MLTSKKVSAQKYIVDTLIRKLSVCFSNSQFANVKAEVAIDHFTKNLIGNLEITFLSQPSFEEIEKLENFPKTWWDAFKLKYFTSWLLKFFPAQLQAIPVIKKHYHICPHVAIPEDQKHYMFLITKESE